MSAVGPSLLAGKAVRPKYNEDMKKSLSVLAIVLFISVIQGCAVGPSEKDIKFAVNDYFRRQDYQVVDLRIGIIEGVPLSERSYMGTPGYVVEIQYIVLEARRDKGPYLRKGSRQTFSNARVRVRQDAGNKDLWHVSIISGIVVP